MCIRDRSNVAIGWKALEKVTTGGDNVAIGDNALADSTDHYNVAIGSMALTASTSGRGNIAIGYQAGLSHTTGEKNIYIGWEAGRNLSGNRNDCIAIGYESLEAGGGSQAIVLGSAAGKVLADGQGNVIIGHESAGAATDVSDNVGIGKWSFANLTTGDDNVAIGREAGKTLTTGSNNTCVGHDSAVSAATVSNEITLGNSSVSALRCQVTSISSLSDRRDKTDINTLDLGLDFINALKPVKFKWASREGIAKDGTYEAGFIAQDFKQVQEDNDADYLKLVLESNPDKLEASPGKLIPILVKAIQDLSTKVSILEQKCI